MTSLPWRISRDVCYQMSNRFAWAWKLTELGVPVVLVYLGFVPADEMIEFKGSHPMCEGRIVSLDQKMHQIPKISPE